MLIIISKFQTQDQRKTPRTQDQRKNSTYFTYFNNFIVHISSYVYGYVYRHKTNHSLLCIRNNVKIEAYNSNTGVATLTNKLRFVLTVSSKEHRVKHPVSCLLIPWRVIAIKWPFVVMISQSNAK